MVTPFPSERPPLVGVLMTKVAGGCNYSNQPENKSISLVCRFSILFFISNRHPFSNWTSGYYSDLPRCLPIGKVFLYWMTSEWWTFILAWISYLVNQNIPHRNVHKHTSINMAVKYYYEPNGTSYTFAYLLILFVLDLFFLRKKARVENTDGIVVLYFYASNDSKFFLSQSQFLRWYFGLTRKEEKVLYIFSVRW